MYKCNECKIDFKTFQAKANHVRWNHKYTFKNKETAKRHSERSKLTAEKRYGKWIEEDFKCSKENCKNEFKIKYREGKKKEKYFCSRSCANSRGPRSVETKSKISESLKIVRKEKCLNCKTEFIKKKKHNTFCSKKCVAEYRSKQIRKTWSAYKLYKSKCAFKFNLKDYPEEFDFSLIESFGWYAAKNKGDNLNGISRDHMFSIKEGFLQNVNFEIIRHPANCQLLRHNDNVSKNKKCSISLNDLKEKIKTWDKKYGAFV